MSVRVWVLPSAEDLDDAGLARARWEFEDVDGALDWEEGEGVERAFRNTQFLFIASVSVSGQGPVHVQLCK